MPIGTLAAGVGLASAGLGVAQNIGQAIAAKKSFSEEEERRLEELKRLREEGQLGLSGS